MWSDWLPPVMLLLRLRLLLPLTVAAAAAAVLGICVCHRCPHQSMIALRCQPLFAAEEQRGRERGKLIRCVLSGLSLKSNQNVSGLRQLRQSSCGRRRGKENVMGKGLWNVVACSPRQLAIRPLYAPLDSH